MTKEEKAKRDKFAIFLQKIAEAQPEQITPPYRDSVYRMLQHLYSLQESDEKELKMTGYKNGAGFSAYDAELLSDIAEKSKQYGSLTPKQAKLVAKKLIKYAGQIASAAPEKPVETVHKHDRVTGACDLSNVAESTEDGKRHKHRDGTVTGTDCFGRSYLLDTKKRTSALDKQRNADQFFEEQEKRFDEAFRNL